MDTKGGSGGGVNWDTGFDIHTLLRIKYITNENLLYSTGSTTQCSLGYLNGNGIQKRGDVCLYIAYLLCCILETELCKACTLQ